MNPKAIIPIRNRIYKDPIYFYNTILNSPPLWSSQEKIFKAVLNHPKITIRAGQNVGKTFCVGGIVVWWMMHPGSIVVTTAPSGRQVKTLLWGEIRKHIIGSRVNLGGNLLSNEWKISEDWYAIGFSTDEPVNVGGFHGRRVLVIVDEASGVPDPIMDALDAVVSGENCRLIYSGNPLQSRGRYFQSFQDPSFHKIKISCWEHPNVINGKEIIPGMVSLNWVKNKKEKWGIHSALYQARVEGEFPEGAADVMIELPWLDFAKQNKLSDEDCEIEAGLDVSDGGADETVFSVRKGPRLLAVIGWHPGKERTMETAGKVVRLIKDWNVKKIKVDKIGVGAGVCSRLLELNPCKVIGVNVAEKPSNQEEYEILRDEVWYGLRDRFKDKRIDMTEIIDDEILDSQLTSIKQGMTTSKGQLKVESKREMKKRNVHGEDVAVGSPDRADSLCLAFYEPRNIEPKVTVF